MAAGGKHRIVVFGASGLLGSALCERLYFDGEFECRALIHSYGNGGRLLRLPIEVRRVDALDAIAVESAVAGCHAVINCSRGARNVMTAGLENMLRASVKHGVKGFVHISSVAIYGDDPPPASRTEDAVPDPGPNAYARLKLDQDEMVLRYSRQGLPAAILCTMNISGPYSRYLQGAVQALQSGQLMLVDGGVYPMNLTHVDNLAHAALTAVRTGRGWGKRYFVNEVREIPWKRFYGDLCELAKLPGPLPSVPRHYVTAASGESDAGGGGVWNVVRTLVSAEFRNSLAAIPALRALNEGLYERFNRMSPQFQNAVRARLEKPVYIPKDTSWRAPLSHEANVIQARRVFHSPERIVQELGYRPLYDYETGLETMARWLRFARLIPDDAGGSPP
jgi:nucleoside-diphosphate-sugar epimerase